MSQSDPGWNKSCKSTFLHASQLGKEKSIWGFFTHAQEWWKEWEKRLKGRPGTAGQRLTNLSQVDSIIYTPFSFPVGTQAHSSFLHFILTTTTATALWGHPGSFNGTVGVHTWVSQILVLHCNCSNQAGCLIVHFQTALLALWSKWIENVSYLTYYTETVITAEVSPVTLNLLSIGDQQQLLLCPLLLYQAPALLTRDEYSTL